ncbi:MAG: hypothetical protein ACI399_05165 [Candidatus Cryptobacteroides sp.]
MNTDVSRQLGLFRDRMANAGLVESFAIGAAGQGLLVRCYDFKPDHGTTASLRRSFLDVEDLPEGYEIFNVFTGTQAELGSLLSKEMLDAPGRNVYSDEHIRMIFSYEHALFSVYVSSSSETFIWLCRDERFEEKYITHPFVTELSWWAQRHGMLLLHGASVGVNGDGVVISGLSGSGKSTLSMSALLHDMEFVSDDYLLLGCTDGEVMSHHIFSSGYLTGTTLDLLPEYRSHVIFKSEARNKYVIDLEAYDKHLVPSLHIKAIVVPHIAGVEEPSIAKARSGLGLVNLIASSSAQNKEVKNASFFLKFMQMVKDLPVYDLQLSPDVRLNARFLRQWISQFQS